MEPLDEARFVRSKLLDDQKSAWKKYAGMVIGRESIGALFHYELVVLLVGAIPGALGLALRKMLYPSLFRHCGRNVNFGRNLTIRNGKNIDLGDNVTIDDYALLDGRGAVERGVQIGDNCLIGRGVIIHSKVGDIRIGENCNVGTNSVIVSSGGIEIADWVQIAGGCKISGGKFKADPSLKTGRPYVRYTDGPIEIGEACFIGGSVDVTDGCKIGKGSVIGTGAVVMSNIADYSVYMPRPGMVMGRTIAEPESTDELKPGQSK